MKIYKLLKSFFRKSIFNKLILSYIFIILLPTAVISYYSYSKLIYYTKETYFNDNIKYLKSIERNLQIYFEDFERLTYNAISSENLLSILKSDSNNGFESFNNRAVISLNTTPTPAKYLKG